MTITHYDEEFYSEYGWASCFECDVIFYNLEELDEHQEEHIKQECSSNNS